MIRVSSFAFSLLALAACAAPAISVAPATAAIAAPAPAPAVIAHPHVTTTMHGIKGPVVVLIPGMSTPGAVWDDTVAALSPTHRLLVVEVNGFAGGRVPANEAPGMMDGIVADLSADLERRGIAKAAIVGHSFGGLLAMKFALDRPAQTERVMVVDALPFFGTVFDGDATVATIAPQAARMQKMMVDGAEAMRAAGAKGTTSGAGAASMALDEAAQLKIANWSLKAEPLVVGQALREDLETDLRPDIARIAVPMLVLYQAHQMPELARMRYEKDYAAQPKAVLVPVSDTSHFIMLDRPALFLDQLRAFVG